MASPSSTYASKYRQWPSPWLSSPNSHSVASRRFLQPLSSPFPRRAIFSRDSMPRFRYCNSSGFPIHRQRSFVGFLSLCNRRIYSFRAGISDSTPSPAPPSDPPPEGESISGALSTVQDRIRIFFAVFFWMALFFWASAWDGRNGGKRNKGTRFK